MTPKVIYKCELFNLSVLVFLFKPIWDKGIPVAC
nr:MAG TPA: hypothetical protein [Caudoviricetes sp.]